MKRSLRRSIILDLLRELSVADTILLTAALVPLYLGAIFATIGFLSGTTATERIWAAVLIGAVVTYSLILYRVGIGLEDERRRAARLIRDYLLERRVSAVSFDRIGRVIDVSYTPEFLLSVIDYFPDELRLAKIKGGKRGVGLVIEEEELP